MGDSQTQRINENLIGSNVVNISSSGEHYYFTFQKLKKLTYNDNHKIKSIILGFSAHNFSPKYNKFFNLKFAEGKSDLTRYLYYLDPLFDFKFIKKISEIISLEFLKGVYSTPDIYGYFESNNKNPEIEIIEKGFENIFKRSDNLEYFSSKQKKYLLKIDSLCYKENIELILLSTPYHEEFKKRIPSAYFDNLYNIKERLNNRNHINFLNNKINPNLMSDGNHLNIQGSNKYSKIIRNKLK